MSEEQMIELIELIERAVYEAWGCCDNAADAVEYVLAALSRIDGGGGGG